MMMSRLFGENLKKKVIILKCLPLGKSIMLGHSVSLQQISSFTYCLLPPSILRKLSLNILLKFLCRIIVYKLQHYENMSVQYAAISKSGKNDNF